MLLSLTLPVLAQVGAQVGAQRGGETGVPAEELSEAPSPGVTRAGSEPDVLVVRIDTPIHPVAAQILADAIQQAEDERVSALVVEIDTPGGLMTSMREMIRDVLAADVPVIGYVAPPGAQAASAGFFLLMSTDVAAMAPGTNAGAASPIGGQGEDIGGTLAEKIEQDATALMRSLTKRNGRNVEAAEKTVTEALSYDAEQAKELGLIELIAPTLPKLLAAVDGRTIQEEGREPVVLTTRDAVLRHHEPTWFQNFLALVAEPNVAYGLLSIGSLGLMIELYNPGAIFPGVIGGICLILGAFALSVLPVNVAGLALLVLALIFFIAEVKVTSYGLLTTAGVVSLVIGSLMLFKSPDPALRVSLEVIVMAASTTIVVVLFLMFQVLRAHRAQVRTGVEGMVHERGRAQSDLAPRGKVFVHGEIWDAESEAPALRGDPVEVVAVQGMRLRVRPLTEPVPSAGSPSEEG
jgi:membrane-bound serine protease (ClpP class)